RPRRRHERRMGLPALHPGRRLRRGRPEAARGDGHRRPEGRRRPRDGLDQRPQPCLRPRELGVQLMTAQPLRPVTLAAPDPAAKAATLAAALPWLKRYHGRIVVVKYGGNAMTDDIL